MSAEGENVIFIGKKSVMNYVLAVLLQFDVDRHRGGRRATKEGLNHRDSPRADRL